MIAAVLVLFAVVRSGPRQILDIGTFLDQCPDRDPAFGTIARDFEIRRNGLPVPLPSCTEPIHSLPTAQYTDELIVLQGLRVLDQMDRGISGHLPWTPGTLYDWIRSKLGGINIVDGGGSSCCTNIGGKLFMNIAAESDSNRDFDRSWPGIAGNIDLYAHEARHADGFPHSSCCGTPGGCDDTFDPANLSPYGIQWWLNKLWLDGTIDVGYECLPPNEVVQSTGWFLSALSQFQGRFCTNPPPAVDPPAPAGGPCTERRRAVRH